MDGDEIKMTTNNDNMKNKNVLIVGFGKSGIAAAQAMIKLGARISIQDSKKESEIDANLITYFRGRGAVFYLNTMGISLVLLLLLFTPLGYTVNGATRWIVLGPLRIMPGEVAKIAVIAFVAAFLAKDPKRVLSLKDGILPLFGVALVFGGLIAKQPNLSTAITVVGIIIGMDPATTEPRMRCRLQLKVRFWKPG